MIGYTHMGGDTFYSNGTYEFYPDMGVEGSDLAG